MWRVLSFFCLLFHFGFANLAYYNEFGTDQLQIVKDSPGEYGDSCKEGHHKCCEVCDCTYANDTTAICGLNHIWLHVEHNILSLPLIGEKLSDDCVHRYADLDDAKFACQKTKACDGITMDLGVKCDGHLKKYELRRGILFDLWETKFLSWVKKDFIKYENTELVEPFTELPACYYRYATFEEAKFQCKLLKFCVGVVENKSNNWSSCSNSGSNLVYEIRKGGHTLNSENFDSYIMEPRL